MPADHDLDQFDFRKSSYSGTDNCVEVSVRGPDGLVRVRNSRSSGGPQLTFTPDEWTSFLLGVRDGEFELPEQTSGQP